MATQPYLYVGKYGIRYDSKTQLHYMRHRWYAASLVRFLTNDAIHFINRYSYVENNPLMLIDVSGLAPLIVLEPGSMEEKAKISNKGVSQYYQLNEYNLEWALQQQDAIIFLNTHMGLGSVRHQGYLNPTAFYKDDKAIYPTRGFVIDNNRGRLFSNTDLLKLIKKLKKAGKLRARMLITAACSGGSVTPTNIEIGKHITLIANTLPGFGFRNYQVAKDISKGRDVIETLSDIRPTSEPIEINYGKGKGTKINFDLYIGRRMFTKTGYFTVGPLEPGGPPVWRFVPYNKR